MSEEISALKKLHAEMPHCLDYRMKDGFTIPTLNVLVALLQMLDAERMSSYPPKFKQVAGAEEGIREDLAQLIRVCLTNPKDIVGFIAANYPKEYAKAIESNKGKTLASEQPVELPVECLHRFGNMDTYPRICWGCGKNESEINTERMMKTLCNIVPQVSNKPDDCREEFEKWWAKITKPIKGYVRPQMGDKELAFMGWNARAPKREASGVKKWEYLHYLVGAFENAKDVLASHGAQGWELCTIDNGCRYYFKREINQIEDGAPHD
jgi:hypothetical protein